MNEGDQRTDPVSGEPEIFKDGAWITDWGLIAQSVSTPTPVSNRLGEFCFAKSGSTVTGYLAVTPGTVTNGAIDFPLWAAMYPEFVSGDNIVFSSNVAGMFLRNIGGNATVEGNFQSDATAVNGLRALSRNQTNVFAQFANSWTDDPTAWSNAGVLRTHATFTGDTETRPFNRAFQLYTIVDTYVENIYPMNITNADTATAGQTLRANGDGTFTFV